MQSEWENKVSQVAGDQELLKQVMDLRKQYGDDDEEPWIKTKDIKRQNDVHIQMFPPLEQLLAGFSTRPVYTPLGQQFIQPDGSAAFIQVPGQPTKLQIGDFRPCIKYETNTITSYEEYELSDSDGTYSTTLIENKVDDVMCVKPDVGENTVGQNIKKLINNEPVDNSDAQKKQKLQLEQFGNIKATEEEYVCQSNPDWKIILFWKFILDFTSTLDLTRLIVMYIIRPVEILLNQMFDSARRICIARWCPLNWLPVITWWEDYLIWVQITQYKDACSIAKFKKNVSLATTLGGNEIVKRIKMRQIRVTNALSTEQQQMLQLLQIGYNQFKGSSLFSVEQIKRVLGRQIFAD